MSSILRHSRSYLAVIFAFTFLAFSYQYDLRDLDVIEAENHIDGSNTLSTLTVHTIKSVEIPVAKNIHELETFSGSDTTTLATNPGPSNNGGSSGWAMFLNIVGVGTDDVDIVQMSTASTAVAFAMFDVEIFTRMGNALGGPVGSGPGSSADGWTSLGTVPATQGPVGSGVSSIFNIPTITVPAGDTVGVAIRLTGAGPRYFGTGTPPYSVYTDANISITTGDGRSVPFTPTGAFFTSRAHVGAFRYVISAPPPGNPNWGNNSQAGNNLYYFANSLATMAPSYPTYEWKDTTGSTNLILNGVETATINNGNLDDGRFDVIGQLPPGNSIRFFGVNYSDFYIVTNGLVAFYPLANASSTWNVPGTGLPNATVTNAFFAFWKDFNYGDVDVPLNRLSYKITSTEVIVTFDRAPNFGATDPDDYASFQIIMEHGPSPTENTRMFTMFNFDQTGSTFITKYNANTLTAHIIGLQNENAADKVLSYRFRNGAGVIDPAGPIFGSNLSVGYGPNENILPVDLISFNASVDANDVMLTWTTAWEENNARFDVQRRAANLDANWTTIGSVTGNGTTYEPRNYSYEDKNLASGSYEYRLVQFDYDGNSTADFNLSQSVEVGIPSTFALAQNYPNPFNPTTKIDFQIPVEGLVKLSVFDMSGREVATLVNEALTPGYYTYDFNGSNLSSGAYFYRLVTSNSVMTKRMVLVK